MFIPSLSILIISATTVVAATAPAASCYCKNSDTIASSCYGGIGAVPCGNATNGGFVQCCGKGDICGADGFCHYTHSQVLGSGYYIGGCTDPTYLDQTCPQGCTSEPAPDVVYNSASQLWACCSGAEGATNCSDPTTDTFQAPAPEILFAKTTSTTSTSATSTSTRTSSTSQTSTSTTSLPSATASSSSSSLSSGAAAGIGVGVAIALLAIAGIIAFTCFRRRRRGRAVDMQSPQEVHTYDMNAYSKDAGYHSPGMVKDRKYDISSDKHHMALASELPDRGHEPSELSGLSHSKNAISPAELAER